MRLSTYFLVSLYLLVQTTIAQDKLPAASTQTTVLTGAAVAEGQKVKLVEDKDALSGTYATHTGSYRPLAMASVPTEGSQFNVWVRYRNAGLQMKALIDGTWKAYDWIWARHADGFAWRKVGTFTRAELGAEIIFITPPSTPESGGIDGIVITDELDWTPGKKGDLSQFDAPDAANATVELEEEVMAVEVEPGEATISFDWENVLGEISPYLYSMNSPAMFFEDRVSKPSWAPLMEYLQPRLLRLHSTGQIKKSWMDTGDETWRYDRIEASLKAAKIPEDTELLINIYRWPDSFDEDGDGRLDEDRIDDFAALCADLVRFVNVELGMDVHYWEVTNERDFPYWRRLKKGNQPDPLALAELYNRAAVAMKEVDPTIYIGGPAACSPLPTEPLIEFALAARENLDFLSFHSYATGETDESDAVIYQKAGVMLENVRELIGELERALGDEMVDIHLNEYNISYNWRLNDVRMRNHKGAVFDALLLIAFANTPGLTAANAWNDTERVYGKSDGNGNLRPGAHVFHYFNEYFQGEQVTSVSSVPDAVVPFAVIREDGGYSNALVNRSGARQTVTLDSEPFVETVWYCAYIDEHGLHATGPTFPFRDPLVMPADSVYFFWQPAS